MSLTFSTGAYFNIKGFWDSDYASDMNRRRSIRGFVFIVGGNTVSWRSCLQKVDALLTTVAEYITLSESGREVVRDGVSAKFIGNIL